MRLCIVIIFLSLMSQSTCWAEDEHAAHKKQLLKSDASLTQVNVPDVQLITSDGQAISLVDLLKNKIVIVDFIFTHCETICPVITDRMRSVQNKLSEVEQEKILFLSISVDPINDTPSQLKAYSEKRQATRNWIWLTGKSSSINQTLSAFGLTIDKPESHPPTILLGHISKNRWQRWIGIPSTESMLNSIQELIAEDNDHDHH